VRQISSALASVLFAVGSARAAVPYLLTDLFTGTVSSTPSNLRRADDHVYFQTFHDDGGLWRTDGTAEGTVPVDALPPRGPGFFSQCDDAHGCELWHSDGTAEGTRLVADIVPGKSSSFPSDITPYGDGVVFSAFTNLGFELWRSDGTADGTQIVVDRVPGSSSPRDLTVFDGLVYFSAMIDGDRELWVTDGTPEGTKVAVDLTPGAGGPFLDELTVFDGALFFVAGSDESEVELWRSDGTSEGTMRVTDVVPGDPPSPDVYSLAVGELFATADRLYFRACDQPTGCEPWATDGTPEGTAMVADVQPGPGDGSPRFDVELGGAVLFTADDGVSGREPWRTDGTAAGTWQLADVDPGSLGGSMSGPPTVLGDIVVFAGLRQDTGSELWRTDGTPEGTVLVRDLATASGGSEPGPGIVVDGSLVFPARDVDGGKELWRTDATAAGTARLADVRPGSAPSHPTDLTNLGGVLWFTASSDTFDREAWMTDGTPAGTRALGDLFPPESLDSPHSYTAVGNDVFFLAEGHLWRSDGTPEGTVAVDGVDSYGIGSAGGALVFETGDDLRRLDASGSTKLGPAGWESASSGSLLYYRRCPGGGASCELWRTDGTPDGTLRLLPLEGQTEPGVAQIVGTSDGGARIVASRAHAPWTYDTEVWKTDGTPEGTVLVSALGAMSWGQLLADGASTYVAGKRAGTCSLVRVDGNGDWTTIWQTHHGASDPCLRGLEAAGPGVVFIGCTAETACPLWQSDGTAAGTHATGGPTNALSIIGTLADTVVFTAYDPAVGTEPWVHLAGCGDGDLDPGESCDAGAETGAVTSDCSAQCTPQIPGTTSTSTSSTTSTTAPGAPPTTTTTTLPSCTPASCDDDDACTADACDMLGGCTHEALDGPTCVLTNLRALVPPPCGRRCGCDLGRAVEKTSAIVGTATGGLDRRRCNLRVTRAVRRVRALRRLVRRAETRGCNGGTVSPEVSAQVARLLARVRALRPACR